MNKLIIIGASGHGKVVADIAALNGYKDIVFLDNDPEIKACAGYPVLGPDTMTSELDGDVFIAVGNAKIIFYNIDEKYNLINVFDYSLEINGYDNNETKIFKQDQNYCYVYVQNAIYIFKFDLEQKKIERLFYCYLEISDTNSILPFQNGLLFGCNVPFFQYLTKVKDEFKLIESLLYLKNDIIFDMTIYYNYLYIIGNCNILIFEIENE